MKSATTHLANYAAYHQDPRNFATHVIGIPMIFFAVIALLSRLVIGYVGSIPISFALIGVIVLSIYYIKLQFNLGLVMGVLSCSAAFYGQMLAAMDSTTWLTWSVGLFVAGWIIQFIGHFFEGKKPAFVNDIMGLIIGPMFIVAEIAFKLNLLSELEADINKTLNAKN